MHDIASEHDWLPCLCEGRIHDTEAKYYADGEDAYDMRKQLRWSQKTGDKEKEKDKDKEKDKAIERANGRQNGVRRDDRNGVRRTPRGGKKVGGPAGKAIGTSGFPSGNAASAVEQGSVSPDLVPA